MKLRSGARVAVAGAGALGSAVTLRLARLGFEVTVFDPSPPGVNASGVAAGMLAPLSEALFDPASRHHLDLMRRARALWPDFAQALGVALVRSGVRIEGADAWRGEVAARLDAFGAPADALGIEDWRIDARQALAALHEAARQAGAAFQSVAVQGFKPGVVELADGRREAFDALVLATGPGVRHGGIAPEAKALEPIKGQILRLPERDEGEAPVVRGEGVYLAPGASLAIGATMEHGRDDLAPDPAATRALRAAAAILRPDLDLDRAAVDVGVRVTTPDGLPLVGWSQTPGVMLAVGARRNGWLFAPLVADMVAAYLTGDNLGQDATAMYARRFEKP